MFVFTCDKRIIPVIQASVLKTKMLGDNLNWMRIKYYLSVYAVKNWVGNDQLLWCCVVSHKQMSNTICYIKSLKEILTSARFTIPVNS